MNMSRISILVHSWHPQLPGLLKEFHTHFIFPRGQNPAFNSPTNIKSSAEQLNFRTTAFGRNTAVGSGFINVSIEYARSRLSVPSMLCSTVATHGVSDNIDNAGDI